MLTAHKCRYSGQHRGNFEANIVDLIDLKLRKTSTCWKLVPGAFSSTISKMADLVRWVHRHARRARVIFL